MGDNSAIEWTDASWNPVRGCVKVSPGCKNCYSEAFSERFRGVPGHPYEQGFDPRLVPEMLDQPLRWKKPRKIFVNSMSDLFGEFVSNEYIAACFGVMAACPHHTFQILTKRAERLPEWFGWVARREHDGRALFPDDEPSWRIGQLLAVEARRHGEVNGYRSGTKSSGWEDFDPRRQPWPLPNAWLGVSVEDRKYGLPRIEHLRKVPAAVRFVSIEPLLEDIADGLDLTGIQWCIIGGESGPGARPMDLEWARRIVAVCRRFGVPVFFKQAGARPIDFSHFQWSGSPSHPWTGGASRGHGQWNLLSPKGRTVAQIWQNSPDHFTWHTWDVRGIGGENASDPTLEQAQSEVVKALRRQAFRSPDQWHVTSPLARKGGDLDEIPIGLRMREWPAVPR